MKRIVIALVALILGVTGSVASDNEPGYEQPLDGGWTLKIWDENKVWQGCSVDKTYADDQEHKLVSLGFLLGSETFKMAMIFENPPFFVAGREEADYSFRVDEGPIFSGKGYVESDTAFLVLDHNLSMVKEIQDGKRITIKVMDTTVWFGLRGSRNALNTLLECYKLGMKSRYGK